MTIASERFLRHGLDHLGGQEPVVHLFALVLFLEAFQAQVTDLDRLLLGVHVHGHVTGHVHFRRLPN